MKKNLSFLLIPFFMNAQIDDTKDRMNNKGFFNITKFTYTKTTALEQDVFISGEGNFSYDLKTNNAQSFALQTINGYFFNPHFSVGLGVGLEGHKTPTLNTFPIFIDIRTYLKDDYSSPFAFLDFGGLAHFGNEFNRGNMFAIGVGYKFFPGEKRNIGLVTDISFSAKNISLTEETLKTSNNNITTRGVSLSLGIIF